MTVLSTHITKKDKTESKLYEHCAVNSLLQKNVLDDGIEQVVMKAYHKLIIMKFAKIEGIGTIIIIINSLTVRVIGAPQMILQPVFSIFPCSLLPSGTCRTPGLSIP